MTSVETKPKRVRAARKAKAEILGGQETISTGRPDRTNRVAIEAVSPEVDGGLFAIKRVLGNVVIVEADVFSDGHDKIAADILFRRETDAEWRRVPMGFVENDRWTASFELDATGAWLYTVEAWRDPFASWVSDTRKKLKAQLNISVELREGVELVRAAIPSDDPRVQSVLALSSDDLEDHAELILSEELAAAMERAGPRQDVSRYPRELKLIVDRQRAQFSAWYELFPRSLGGEHRHGTFDDVIAHLPYVRDLGFDVLYFPPIHPIGSKNRKGRNNSLQAGEMDPGSVYAIGSAAGGHDTVHPELGTMDDFRRLIAAAKANDLEIALDFAVQCSPDHPWIKEHPDWFEWRPDGTIKFAENPPKKYEDIVNIRFDGPGYPSAWEALRDAVLVWVNAGVRILRVDNPHTKPLPFWRWLIAEVNRDYPDVIFLAEAFTRPKMMKRLAKEGFQQSYTYFTWRNSKYEISAYSTELAGDMGEFYRPNFFVNTPDINPFFLQTSGRPGFIIRSTLAATLSSNWGMYSGFEICESLPLPGREEYLDSEKYQFRERDLGQPGNIRDYIRSLNAIRRDNEALHDFRNVAFLNAWNDNVIAYLRQTPGMSNSIFIMVNLDPHHPQEATYEIPLWRFGLPDDASLDVEDLLLGIRFTLHGKTHRIRLDPSERSAVIWRLIPPQPRGVSRD